MHPERSSRTHHPLELGEPGETEIEVFAYLEQPELQGFAEPYLAQLGLQAAGVGFSGVWDALTLPNRRRLIRLLVEEVQVDQRVGKLSVRLKDLAEIQAVAEVSC